MGLWIERYRENEEIRIVIEKANCIKYTGLNCNPECVFYDIVNCYKRCVLFEEVKVDREKGIVKRSKRCVRIFGG